MIETIELQVVQPQSWRNGGGSTCELLAWPPGAPWQCRISLARIEKNGPFSQFAGITRFITVVQGKGLVLHFGERRALLSASSEPFEFDGAAAPECELLDGASQDLNLMANNAAGRGGMFKAQLGQVWQSSATLRAVYSAKPALLQVDDEPGHPLPANTLAFCDQAAHQRWRLTPQLSASLDPPGAWWMQFEPHGQ